ncbi:hypothetical protein [Dactylosporangium sp. CA-233914]|uniref:hypothetical protein n=1 Tax=Dactylosporangium sp. CA-233914 TaxID=3239934 RepID=UPI003D8CA248
MTALAEAFVRGTAAETGISIGWGEQDAANLDRLCEEFLRSRPSAKVKHSMIMSMGAYLGELIVRATRGRWGYDADLREAVVETGDGVMGWPHTKVAKRFEQGPKHSLYQYYRYAVHPEQRDAIAAGGD